MNYFIEGLQGSGKSTIAARLADMIPGAYLFAEGDYSPVELAWCAYMTREQYAAEIKKFPSLKDEIANKTFWEGDRAIVCYTKIRTDAEGFYPAFEKYEIYNGRISPEEFRNIIFRRLSAWNGGGGIFECSLLQNMIEDFMLYYEMTDSEIIGFYREIAGIQREKEYRIVYLDAQDVPGTIDAVKKERCDENGREIWYGMLLEYIENSPFGRHNGLKGYDGLIRHLERRRSLELAVLREVFPGNHVILGSKNYTAEDLRACVQA